MTDQHDGSMAKFSSGKHWDPIWGPDHVKATLLPIQLPTYDVSNQQRMAQSFRILGETWRKRLHPGCGTAVICGVPGFGLSVVQFWLLWLFKK